MNEDNKKSILDALKDISSTVAILHARKDLDDTDTASILDVFKILLSVYEYKSRGYGPSWKNDELDARVLYGDTMRKVQRLNTIFWHREPRDWEIHKIVESLLDMALYNILTILRLHIERGIDWKKVHAEVTEQRSSLVLDEDKVPNICHHIVEMIDPNDTSKRISKTIEVPVGYQIVNTKQGPIVLSTTDVQRRAIDMKEEIEKTGKLKIPCVACSATGKLPDGTNCDTCNTTGMQELNVKLGKVSTSTACLQSLSEEVTGPLPNSRGLQKCTKCVSFDIEEK